MLFLCGRESDKHLWYLWDTEKGEIVSKNTEEILKSDVENIMNRGKFFVGIGFNADKLPDVSNTLTVNKCLIVARYVSSIQGSNVILFEYIDGRGNHYIETESKAVTFMRKVPPLNGRINKYANIVDTGTKLYRTVKEKEISYEEILDTLKKYPKTFISAKSNYEMSDVLVDGKDKKASDFILESTHTSFIKNYAILRKILRNDKLVSCVYPIFEQYKVKSVDNEIKARGIGLIGYLVNYVVCGTNYFTYISKYDALLNYISKDKIVKKVGVGLSKLLYYSEDMYDNNNMSPYAIKEKKRINKDYRMFSECLAIGELELTLTDSGYKYGELDTCVMGIIDVVKVTSSTPRIAEIALRDAAS